MKQRVLPEQTGIPCTILRGGTSKGVYFHEADLPPRGALRDRVLKRIMGTPDVVQIDGLGGSRLITSKIAIIKRSSRGDADVDFTFGQLEVEQDAIHWSGNCGNISAGVGPFAINAGLVEVVSPVTVVRIYNTNTDKVLIAHVPVRGGRAKVTGDFTIDGVPGTGAEIFMDYHLTLGARTGRMLPTENAVDTLELEGGDRIEVTLCDVGNPCAFFRASDVGLTGSELPDAINGNRPLLTRLEDIRRKSAERMGFSRGCSDRSAEATGGPLLVLVAPPAEYGNMRREQVLASDMDLRARLVFFNKCHESMAGTGSMCTAAASRIPGSLVNQALGAPPDGRDTLRIGHPLGIMRVRVKARDANTVGGVAFDELGFGRTARHIMEGTVYVPTSTFTDVAAVSAGKA
ncbi:PrpF domain-containing protein [Bradyrhizobium sp. B097]|uniref:2-methylaconitate cis-trans isomerase PrpF family protein n=1 Tax=Bradyrhizobium sp. B097 TaxID=3140244 RepID=UPI0031840911